MRLIDADALIEKADYLFKSRNTETVDFMRIGYNHAVADVIAIAKNIPTADIMKRKKGKWEYVSFMTVRCSNCKEIFHELEGNNYCPNCGAKMEREEEDG